MIPPVFVNACGLLFSAFALAALGGCGTIVNGGSQMIAVNTVPAGAACDVTRTGEHLGWISNTPGTIDVTRSRKPLTIRCEKPGFQPIEGTVGSIASGAILGNLVFGYLVGMIVDFSTGANYDYHETVFIRFEPPPAPVF